MKTRTVVVAAGILLCGLSAKTRAQSSQPPTPPAAKPAPLITDRPDFTESPQTVPAGMVQVEAGITIERQGKARQTTLGETLIRIAAGNRAEVRIGVPSFLTTRDDGRATGFDDAFLGTKLVLSASETHPLALLVGTTLPVGSRRVAARKFSPEAVLATEGDLTKKIALAANAGVGLPNEGNGTFTQFFGSASFGFDLSNRVGAYAEVYAFNRAERGGGSQKFINGGFTYALKPELQVDARLGFGVNNHVGSPDCFYGFGVSQRF